MLANCLTLWLMVNYYTITHLRHVVTRLWFSDLLPRCSQESLFIDFSNKLHLNLEARKGINDPPNSSDTDILSGSSWIISFPLTVQCKDWKLLMWIPIMDAVTLSRAWLNSVNKHQTYPNSSLFGILDEDELTRCQERAASRVTGFVSRYTITGVRGPGVIVL